MSRSVVLIAILAGFAAGLLVAAPPAEATVMTDFRNDRNQKVQSLSLADLTITATRFGSAEEVNQSKSYGLGVKDNVLDDKTGKNGSERSEFLLFSFSVPVTLGSWVFSDIKKDEESFSVFVDGVEKDLFALFGSDRFRSIGDCGKKECEVDLSALGTGSVFTFSDGTGSTKKDSFAIAAISYQMNAAVPEPALGGLFGFAALILVLALRQRRPDPGRV
ncbi:hypothetical protein [Oceanibacterium hippocampi]|uniref:PEP-CTERM protein-sorting domain-containing protein n=1 Tax=Oceanibacterium hippocampi TaxID=745714 RepID=A0A1Y5TY83_9PROT|nr:hypothetical protein [Oceanibacterium hippocampi]SLN73726.1 hypothetical protein OCH7691_03648 [Oceanibacterium hippocampi]